LERERLSHTLSQIASVVAGLALLSAIFVMYPEDRIKSLAKGMAISVSLAVLAAVLITAVRNYGS
jgi:hypothetical protein